LFLDYNGNGIQDPEEPAVPNAKLSLVGPVKFEAMTDSAGDYKIEDAPAGSYKLNVQADQRFKYMCTSTEEFRAVTKNYDLSLDGLRKMDIGLMEGFLTAPFSNRNKYSRIESHVDLDSIVVKETPSWNIPWYRKNGQLVKRGEVVGYCGNTGLGVGLVHTYFRPHLHFQIWQPKTGTNDWMPLDPYRDLCYGKHGDSPWSNPSSLWTVDNNPQYPS